MSSAHTAETVRPREAAGQQGECFEQVLARLMNMPGEEGIEARRKAYAPFFMRMGRDVRIDTGCRFTHPDRIVLDDDVRINVDAIIYGSGGVRIGRHARIGPRVFIHSANHDVAPGPTAFHERGHTFERVVIGDNVLISANVSVMPGARLGSGVFVSCGAVVTRGEVEDGAVLMGVPARARKTPTTENKPSPLVGLVAPKRGPWRDAAELLAESIAMPQVAVADSSGKPPGSMVAAFAIGPKGWMPRRYARKLPVWTLDELDGVIEGAGDLAYGGETIARIPRGVTVSTAPVFESSRSALDNACVMTLCYALKRLRKRGKAGFTDADRVDLASGIAGLRLAMDSGSGGESSPRLIARACELLDPEDEDEAALRGEAVSGEGDWRGPAARVIARRARASESMRAAVLAGKTEHFSLRTFRSCPELMLAIVLEASEDRCRAAIGFADELLSEADKASTLALIALSAAAYADLSGEPEISGQGDKALDRLTSGEYYDPKTGTALSLPGGSASSSLAVAAALLIRAGREQPGYAPAVPESRVDPFSWCICREPDEADWVFCSESRSGGLVDHRRRLVSRSLLENWVRARTAPLLASGQFELEHDHYAPVSYLIERVWRSVIAGVIRDAGSVPIVLDPWPAGAPYAVSLRYDIDRPCTGPAVRGLIEAQSRALNRACGTWFAIPGTDHGDDVTRAVGVHLQEIGVHALQPRDALRGVGVTHHSAPNSTYWRGRETAEAVEHAAAAYGEHLSGQLVHPGRPWVGHPPGFVGEDGRSGGGGRALNLWAMPVHFPLEGSTGDKGLDYFDLLADRFEEIKRLGGHVIIGSHPDLGPGLLGRLIERKDIETDAWLATIGEVIERSRRVREIGMVFAVGSGEDWIELCSRHTLADLAIRVVSRSGSPGRAVVTQLLAQQARRVKIE